MANSHGLIWLGIEKVDEIILFQKETLSELELILICISFTKLCNVRKELSVVIDCFWSLSGRCTDQADTE
jgi:hypothetical protein